MDQLTGKQAQGFVKGIEGVFKGLPHLPKGIVDFLVSASPWLAGIGGIFGVFGGVNALFFTSRNNTMWKLAEYYSGTSSVYFQVTSVLSILSGLLLLMAYKHLKNKKIDGWMLLFWAEMLAVVQMVATVVFGYGGLVGTIISLFIAFYVLFEIKPKYK